MRKFKDASKIPTNESEYSVIFACSRKFIPTFIAYKIGWNQELTQRSKD